MPPPLPSPAQRQSQLTSRWLGIVAEHYDTPRVVMARHLGTPAALAIEVARLLHRAARLTAERLVRDDGTPPAGTDLLDRLTLAYYTPLLDAKKAAARAKAKVAFDAELRQQEKRAAKAKAGVP
jgi:hypothetical protein